MKVTFKILLAAAVLLMTYVCVESIMGPINFKNERQARESEIVARLIEIRKAQIEYKNVYKEHAGSFDDLIRFLKEEKLPFLVKEGVLSDEQLEAGMTEQEAVKQGIIVRDTFWINAKDTLFGKDYNVDDIRFVPTTNKRVEFALDTATLESSSGYVVKVFQAGVKYDDYLGDLDKQEVINLNDRAEKLERYPGLRVGSVTDINNNAGNWENL